MNARMSTSEIKQRAWENTRRHWSDLLLSVILAGVICWFTGSILQGPVTVGLFFVMYSSLRGEIVSPTVFFDGFKRNIFTSILTGILISLISFILPTIMGTVLSTIATRIFRSIGYRAADAAVSGELGEADLVGGTNAGLMILLAVICILCAVLSLYLFYCFTMAYYLILMEDGIGVGEAISKSIKVMKKNKRRYFLFDLSFIGWFLLCCITFGVLLLWVVPYFMSARIILMEETYKNSPYRSYTSARERNYDPLIESNGEMISHKKSQYYYNSPPMPQEKYCTYCGAEKEPGMKFCQICGRAQTPPSGEDIARRQLFCKWCGEKLPGGARFCVKCGRKQ